jgi:hypothetical protein
MKEPIKRKLNLETPTSKDVKKIPLPPQKTEWDIIGQDNDDTYVSSDLETIKNNLDKNNNEDSENSN